MSSIKELRKQLIDARKSVLAPTKKMKRDEIVLELEKYKKPSAPVAEPAPAPKAKKEAPPPSIKIPEIPKETAVDRAIARKPKRPVEEEVVPPAPKAKAKKEEVFVKPEDIKKVLNKPPPPSKKGTPEMAEKMAKLRASKKKPAQE